MLNRTLNRKVSAVTLFTVIGLLLSLVVGNVVGVHTHNHLLGWIAVAAVAIVTLASARAMRRRGGRGRRAGAPAAG